MGEKFGMKALDGRGWEILCVCDVMGYALEGVGINLGVKCVLQTLSSRLASPQE